MRPVQSEQDQSLFKVHDKLLSPAALRNFLALMLALFLLSCIPNSIGETHTTQAQEQPSSQTEFVSMPETELRLYEAGLGIYLDFYRTSPLLSETFADSLFEEIYTVLEEVAQGKIDKNHESVQILRDGWATSVDRAGMVSHAHQVIASLPDESFGSGADVEAARELLYSMARQSPGFFVPQGFTFRIDELLNEGVSNINGKSNGSLITMGDVPESYIGNDDLDYRLTLAHEQNHSIDGKRLTLDKVKAFKKFIPLELFVTYITQYTESTYSFLKHWVLLPAKEALKFNAAMVANWNLNTPMQLAEVQPTPTNHPTASDPTPVPLTAEDRELTFMRTEIAKWIAFLGTTQEQIVAEMKTQSITVDTQTMMRYLAWKVTKRLAADPDPRLRQNQLITYLLSNRYDKELGISMNGIVESVDHSFVHPPDSPTMPILPLFLKYHSLVNAARERLVATKYETPKRLSIVSETEKPIIQLPQFDFELLGVYPYAPDNAHLMFYRLPSNPFTPEVDHLMIEFSQRLQLESDLPDKIINPWNFIIVLSDSVSRSLDPAQLTFEFDSTQFSSFSLTIYHKGHLFGKIYENAYGEFASIGEIDDVICIKPETVLYTPVISQEVSTDQLLVDRGNNDSQIFEVDLALAHYFTPGYLSLFALPPDSVKRESPLPFLLLQNPMHFPPEEDGYLIYNNRLLPNGNLTTIVSTGHFNDETRIFSSNSFEYSFDETALEDYLAFRNRFAPDLGLLLHQSITAQVIETPTGPTVQYYVVAALWSSVGRSNEFIDRKLFPVHLVGSSKYGTVDDSIFGQKNQAQLASKQN